MGSLNDAKKMIVDTTGKAFRNDFMIGHGQNGHGKGHAKDSLTRQRPSGARILTAQECKDLYISNPLVKNIIDIIPEDMTRSGWVLKCDDKKLKDGIESKFNKLKLKKQMQKLFADDRLFGDGYASIGVIMADKKAGESLSEPIKEDKLMSIPYINTFSTEKVNRYYENVDMFSEHYREIEFFEINRQSQLGNEILSMGLPTSSQERVHRSRILHQQSFKFEDEFEGHSILESLYDIITVMDTSLWSVGQILYDFTFKIFKSPNADDLDKDKKSQLGMVMDYLFRTEALAIIGGDEELTKQSTSVAGMKDLLDFVWEYLSSATRMPKSVLKGQEAGTLTGAQYDVMNYYARVASMQENMLRPILERITRLLMQCSEESWQKTNPDSVEWSIEFNPLWSVDSKTDAEIRKLNAETDEKYIVNGVLGPDAVFDKRFGRFDGQDNSTKNDGITQEDIDLMASHVLDAYNQKVADSNE